LKLLKNILGNIKTVKITGPTNIKISSVNFDSRKIANKALFIAVKGTKTDGHNFISQAIKNGAIAIVCENLPENLKNDITYVKVKNTSLALAYIASNFYDNPSYKIKLIGITGTNGKTTIATLLYNLFRSLGYNAGLISTINNKINDKEIKSTLTTPDALQLNSLLKEMVTNNCSYCFMEISSHSIAQNRIAGLNFTGAIFTNITHDHLDFHKTFHNYLKTKKMFFDNLPKLTFALTNIDDKNGNIILQNTKAKKYTYSLTHIADFKTKIIENQFSGLHLNIDGNDIWCKLVGKFNAYNLLAIYATAIILGKDKLDVLTAISNLNHVEGRFDFIKTPDNIIAIVDYAHTPDALKNVLNTICEIKNKNTQIISVVGAGGDRDKTKRPVMAEIAYEKSDKLILTSDNPRSENPENIINDMEKGIKDNPNNNKVISIINRKQAIKTACALAQSGDIILIAGKGHEKYQEINGVKYPFDDKQILKDILLNNKDKKNSSLKKYVKGID